MGHYVGSVLIKAPREVVFDFHTDTRNLPKIMPGNIAVVSFEMKGAGQGALIDLKMRWRGLLSTRWLIELEVFDRPNALVDLQIKGPFKHFRHVRTFREEAGGTLLTDDLSYELPFGFLGRIIEKIALAPTIRSQFAFRHRKTKEILDTV